VDSLGSPVINVARLPIFLDKLNSPVIPGTSGFYGNWMKDYYYYYNYYYNHYYYYY